MATPSVTQIAAASGAYLRVVLAHFRGGDAAVELRVVECQGARVARRFTSPTAAAFGVAEAALSGHAWTLRRPDAVVRRAA